MAKQIFINIPVKNLRKSIVFFKKTGFKFNAKFTNTKGGCLIISENIFVMLVTEKFFQTFTKKKIIDAKKNTETIIALSFDSRKQVDEFMAKVLNAGGKEIKKPADYGYMYERNFQDIDGHNWAPFYMDHSKFPKK